MCPKVAVGQEFYFDIHNIKRRRVDNMVKLEEYFHFSSAKYREGIASKAYSDENLANEIYKKRRNLVASKTKIGTSVAIAVASHGVGLVGVFMGARETDVEKKKLELLEEEWSRRKGYRLDNRVFKDMVVPAVLSAAVGALTLGVDLGMANSAATGAAGYVGCAHPVSGLEGAVTGNTFPGIGDSAAAGAPMTNAGHIGCAYPLSGSERAVTTIPGAETCLRQAGKAIGNMVGHSSKTNYPTKKGPVGPGHQRKLME